MSRPAALADPDLIQMLAVAYRFLMAERRCRAFDNDLHSSCAAKRLLANLSNATGNSIAPGDLTRKPRCDLTEELGDPNSIFFQLAVKAAVMIALLDASLGPPGYQDFPIVGMIDNNIACRARKWFCEVEQAMKRNNIDSTKIAILVWHATGHHGTVHNLMANHSLVQFDVNAGTRGQKCQFRTTGFYVFTTTHPQYFTHLQVIIAGLEAAAESSAEFAFSPSHTKSTKTEFFPIADRAGVALSAIAFHQGFGEIQHMPRLLSVAANLVRKSRMSGFRNIDSIHHASTNDVTDDQDVVSLGGY